MTCRLVLACQTGAAEVMAASEFSIRLRAAAESNFGLSVAFSANSDHEDCMSRGDLEAS